jgi:hypothetical protein
MKKHLKNYNGFRKSDKLNETVYQVENTYRVNVIVDVEAKLLSAYSKKVKQNTNKEIQDLMGNAMLAEQIVLYIIKENLDADKIPATAIIGGAQGQGQAQGQAQGQGQSQDSQIQVQSQPAQGQSQDSQVQSQPEPAQSTDTGEDLPI